MDKLEAINLMLSHINQAPITTLQGNKTSRILMAENILNTQTKALQMLSYAFNQLNDYPLYPNTEGEIILPKDTLRFDINKKYYDGNNYVPRGNKIYNATINSYKINKTLYVNLIKELNFDELPEPAKLYVIMQSSNKFVASIKDDRTKIAYSQQEVLEAKQTLDEYEASYGKYNILNVYDDRRYL